MKKIIKLISLLVIFFLSGQIQAQITQSISLDENNVLLNTEGNYTYITLPPPSNNHTTVISLDSVSTPELPVLIQNFILPYGSTVTGVNITTGNKYTFQSSLLINPVQPPCSTNGQPCDSVAPNPAIYNSNTAYPQKKIKIVADRYIFGSHIVSVGICPFEYLPAQRQLSLYKQINFSISYSSNSSIIPNPGKSQMRESLARSYIKSIIANPGDLAQKRPTAILPVDLNTVITDNSWKPAYVTDSNGVRQPIGNVPDYIIITSEALKIPFLNFAEYQTKRGLPTVIAPVEKIYENYPGVDHPEQIRNYLKDVYRTWGEIFVLLGGDSDIIPARNDIAINSLIIGYDFVSDKYYTNLFDTPALNDSYNWNANGNSVFCEDDDGIQINMSDYNILGRIPAKTVDEVNIVLNKIKDYEKLNNVNDRNYVNNILFVGAHADDSNYIGVLDVNSVFNNSIYQDKNRFALIQKPLSTADSILPMHKDTLSVQILKDYINNGNNGNHFQFISHIAHSSQYGIGAGDNEFENSDIADLNNAPYYNILFTAGCYPGAFNTDSFAENYLLQSGGAGVAVLAHTGSGWFGDSYREQNNHFFNSIYGNNANGNLMGIAALNTQAVYGWSTSCRLNHKLTLFGDPSMPVWTDTPQDIHLTAPQNFAITNQQPVPYAVQINDLNQPATLTLYKKNMLTGNLDIYQRAVDVPAHTTSYTFDIAPDEPGELTVTATAKNYIPATATTQLVLNAPHLYVSHVSFSDANQNGMIEPGEAIDLHITLRNSGNVNMHHISTQLSADNLLSNIVQISSAQSSNDGNIDILTQTGQVLDGYTFQVQANGEIPELLKFWLDITDDNGYHHQDEFYLEMKQINLELGPRKISDASGNLQDPSQLQLNEVYDLKIAIKNNTDFTQSSLQTTLTSTSPDLQIVQSTSNYPDIDAFQRASNTTSFQFKILNNVSTLPVTLTLTNNFGLTKTFDFDLLEALPPLIQNFHFTSTSNEIKLNWDPILTSIKGYNVYKFIPTGTNTGHYELINNEILTGASTYINDNLTPATNYHYKISVVTNSNNELDITQLEENNAWTTLESLSGFPIEHSNQFVKMFTSTPTVFDMDGDGKKEIFYKFRERYRENQNATFSSIFGINYQGKNLLHNSLSPNTPFAQLTGESRCKSAIYDLNQDGQAELVTIGRVWKAGQMMNIYMHNITDDNNDNIADIYGNFSQSCTSNVIMPVIADMNNDGYKDIIFSDLLENIYIYDKDQNLITNTNDSHLTDLPGSYFAVGKIDNGNKKIVFAGDYVGTNNNYNADDTDVMYTSNDGQIHVIKTLNFPSDITQTILADLNNDGNLDIIVHSFKDPTTSSPPPSGGGNDGGGDNGGGNITLYNMVTHLYAMDSQGNELLNQQNVPDKILGFSAGDLNNDGRPELVIIYKTGDRVAKLSYFDYNGQIHDIKDNIQLDFIDFRYITPIIADVDAYQDTDGDGHIDGDNAPEIILNLRDRLVAYKLNGTLCPGWNIKPVTSWQYFNGTPYVGDIDNDGKNEVTIADNHAFIYTWKTTGSPNHIEWGSERYNAQNTAAYQPATNLDLMIKDSSIDTGIEPDANTPRMWESEDIWVRNNDDGGMEHENPEYVPNQPVYVYVRVTNRSDVASHLGDNQLKLYWAKASTSLGWPAPWDGTQTNNNNAVMGGTIDTKDIPILQPGESRVIKFTWHIPDPSNYQEDQNTTNHWHFCLLGEITSSVDNLTSPLTNDLHTNVRNNNNLAWKNLTVLDLEPNSNSNTFTATVGVGNPYNTSHAFYLELKKDASEAGKAIYEEAEVKLKMDDVLYEAWERGGKVAQETEDTEDVKKKKVKDNNVILDNIYFLPNEQGKLTLSFNFLTKELTNKEKYHYYLIQHDATTGKVIGGETYLIKKKPRPIFHAEANDLQVDKGEQVSLNANDINETAEYNWYDQEGNLIYSGKDMDIVAAMEKKYKLEVIADIDGFKDYKDVDVKFKPDRITSIYPNPASDNMEIEYKINKSSSAYIMIVGITNPNFVNNYVIDVNQSSYTINVHNFPTGEYSIVLIGDGEIKDVQSVIKE